MMKSTIALAICLIAAIAIPVGAINVNGLRVPQMIAPATSDSLMISAASASDLGVGIMAYSGAGNVFWIEWWQDWDEDGVWEWSSEATPAVISPAPGSLVIPDIGGAQLRGNTWYRGHRFYSVADTLTVIRVNQ